MKPTPSSEFAVEIVKKLRAAGFEALWAGGCVRDYLRGSEPTDYDVATSALPEQVRDVFGRQRTHPVGLSFGVVIVRAPQRSVVDVEVATFRTDASYSDGRHPDRVTFSTPEEDAQRRDFTINGMFYDPVAERVIDYVGGQLDLEQEIIRAIGNAGDRIAEDKLRMLRAVRFAARLGFSIDAATREAIQQSAAQVSIVSGERIAIEMQATLRSTRAAWALSEWSDLELLPGILPEVARYWPDKHSQMLELVASLAPGDWRAVLVCLLFAGWGPSAEPLSSLRSRLKLSNADVGAMRFALTSQPVLQQAASLPWSKVQPTLVDPNLPLALQLLRAREETTLTAGAADWIQTRIHAEPELDPPPLVLGKDLIDLGLRPSPQFKWLLSEIRNRQLDLQLNTREEALAWVRSQVANS